MRALFGLAGLILWSGSVHAQTLPPIHVFGETDKQDHMQCLLKHEFAVNSAESAFRYNQVKIANADSYGLRGYVNLLAAKTSSGLCIVNVLFEVHENLPVYSPALAKKRFLKVEHCLNASLLTGPSYDLQDRVNNTVRGLVDNCVSKISKEIDL